MPPRFELTFDITQAELAAANEAAMRVQPEWERARKLARRSVRNFAIFGVPAAVFLVAAFVGRGSGTRGMYLEGGRGGLLIGGMIAFGLSRLDPVGQEIERTAKRLRAADFSADAGPKTVVIEEHGFQLTSSAGSLKAAWTNAWPSRLGGFLYINTTAGGMAVIPTRVFASEAEATACHEAATGWWKAAQVPHAQRLEQYLADRDLPCPRCTYPLRALRGEACPECGEPIRLERLTGY
jgi:hypothetical protein